MLGFSVGYRGAIDNENKDGVDVEKINWDVLKEQA